MDEEQRTQLGRDVTSARLRRGLGKEPAARAIGVSSITLKRVEDGLSVREDSLAKILTFFDLPLPGTPRPNLETPISDQHVNALRRTIEQSDVPDHLKRRLLGVVDEEPKVGEGDDGNPAAMTGA